MSSNQSRAVRLERQSHRQAVERAPRGRIDSPCQKETSNPLERVQEKNDGKISGSVRAGLDQQQEQEATMESQVAAIESYAQQHGYGLNREFLFFDQAVSGAKLERPAL